MYTFFTKPLAKKTAEWAGMSAFLAAYGYLVTKKQQQIRDENHNSTVDFHYTTIPGVGGYWSWDITPKEGTNKSEPSKIKL